MFCVFPFLPRWLHHIFTFRLVIRIRYDAADAQCPLGIKFGVPPADAGALLATARTLGLNVVGVAFHVGSGSRDAAVFYHAIASAKLVSLSKLTAVVPFETINCGGILCKEVATTEKSHSHTLCLSLCVPKPEGLYLIKSTLTRITRDSVKEMTMTEEFLFCFYPYIPLVHSPYLSISYSPFP